jgi:hypothetical protein
MVKPNARDKSIGMILIFLLPPPMIGGAAAVMVMS